MSRPWRLRHKLVLGLALVVVSVGLLLGGALLGLSSYFKMVEATQGKIQELQCVVQMRDAIKMIGDGVSDSSGDAAPNQSLPEREKREITKKLVDARDAVERYQNTRELFLARWLDRDGGEYEASELRDIRGELAQLEAEVQRATLSGLAGESGKTSVLQLPEVQRAHRKLMNHCDGLFGHLVKEIDDSLIGAKRNHGRSLSITGTATGLAVVIVLTLLHYFRVWVFRPIKELQAGVHRVHGGNFDQPIKLSSKDELEELANEFNAMTVRLRDIYKSLAQQVNERTRQLVRSERMVSVGFLAAGVAHEINNPLASIAFCSEALERRLQDLLARAPEDAETITKYLKMIQQEAFRCKQITTKLLDFSRTGGRREPVELNGLIADVLEVAHHLPNARGKTFRFSPDGQVTALVSGPDIKSVVLNLVVNALDSMDDGGTLTAALAVRGEVAELTFTDTGCGMTADVLENIFEPFFTRNRNGTGTGLGLSISHQIVDQHGGTIHVASDGPGRGSRFVVRLPLRAQETKPEGERRTERPKPAKAAA